VPSVSCSVLREIVDRGVGVVVSVENCLPMGFNFTLYLDRES